MNRCSQKLASLERVNRWSRQQHKLRIDLCFCSLSANSILAKLKTNQSLCARVENNCPINYSSSKSDDDFPHFVDSSVTVVQKTVLKGLPSRSDHMIIWINGANRVSKETVLWRRWGSYFTLPDKGLKLEKSAQKWWPIYIFDSVHETSLSCYTISC